MSNWLNETVRIYSEYESPTRYYYWSLLAAVSAIVKDRVYFDRYLYKLFPNIYVLLFGPSGVKKGPPISLAKDIVSRLQITRVINGRATVEAIIKELGTMSSKPGQPPIRDSSGFIVSSELSSAIIGNTNSLDILTDLFDRIYNDGEWVYRLKNSEPIKLKNPTVTWLAGTNEALFREFVPEKNLKGGLIGRTFVISEFKENTINSLMFKPDVIPDKDKIAQGISHLKNLSGEFRISEELRSSFNKWYHAFRTEFAPKLEDDTGTVGRIDDNILKLAMLLSCAKRGDLEILFEDIEEATIEILSLIVPAKKITSKAAQKDLSKGEKTSLILHHLANQPSVSDTSVNMLRKFSIKLDSEDFDRIIQTLERADAIKVTRVSSKEILYTLNLENKDVQDYVEQYRR